MNIILHMGYPKTATTLLQANVFSVDTNLNFLGPNQDVIAELVKRCRVLSDDEFDQAKVGIRENLAAVLSQDKLNVISHEHLLDVKEFSFPGGVDLSRAFVRVHELLASFGDVKVMFFIRKHDEMLKSYCSEHFMSMIYYNFTVKSVRRLVNREQSVRKVFLLNQFRYFETYNFLCNQVGESRVKLFLYEEFRDNADKVLRDVYSFMGVAFNPADFDLSKQANASADKTIFNRVSMILNKLNWSDIAKLRFYVAAFFYYLDPLNNKKYSFSDLPNLAAQIGDYFAPDTALFEDPEIKEKLNRYNYLEKTID